MQIKSTSIKNLPVISLIQGKRVATIKDFLYDPFENKITAFILHPQSLFGSDKYLLYSDIKSIGKDALLIQSVLSIKNADEIDKNLLLLKQHGSLLTQGKLVTEAGEKLGTVRDFLFEQDNGQVEQLEVTQGGFADFKSGIKTVHIDNIVSIGPDATIVKIKTQDDITRQAQTQGLQAKLNETSDKLGNNLEKVKDKVTSYFKEPATPQDTQIQPKAPEQKDLLPTPTVTPLPSPNYSETITPAPQSLSDLIEPPTSQETYYSKREALTTPPQWDTAPKQTLSESHLEESLSPTPPTQPHYPVKTPAQLDYDQAVEKLRALSENAKDKLTNLKDQAETEFKTFNEKTSEPTPEYQESKSTSIKATHEKPQDRLSQYQAVAYNQISRIKNDRNDKQKKNVVGLFLTKTILDDNDNIIAKRGDIITNKLLTQAEDLDLLDQILKNTSYDPLN